MKFLIKNIQKRFAPDSRGYTLLFAVLVSSVVLAIGVSILTVSRKEFLLSSGARDSASALNAADSGIECATYADEKNNAFSTSTDNTGLIQCGTSALKATRVVDGLGTGTFVFSADFGSGSNDGVCATITVTKSFTNGATSTLIISRGYNTGWDNGTYSGGTQYSCDIPSSKKVERAFQVTY